MKYISYLSAHADKDAITASHTERQKWVNQEKKGFLRYRNPYKRLSEYRAQTLVCNKDLVTIGHEDEITISQGLEIEQQLRKFMPWRKGPFSVFGVDIDAEWRSERKWQRVLPFLPNLEDKVIADIGCNNGYYMFRMAAYKPEFVLGFEPSVQHYYCFKALNAMAGLKNLDIDLLGVEHLKYFAETFDVIFLMGIIYHRPSPIDTLREIHKALKPGGTLIVESQAIPGKEPYALFPDSTYAKVPGTYFVPTGACLDNWLKKAGFTQTKLFDSHPMSNEEQHRTDWMVFESYQDFIDPQNQSLTVEGYPAPHRVYLSGVKKA